MPSGRVSVEKDMAEADGATQASSNAASAPMLRTARNGA